MSFNSMKSRFDRPVFNHIPLPVSNGRLEQVTLPGGKRHYITPEGNHYSSVTTMLSSDKKLQTALKNWRKRIGVEQAATETSDAANRGTAVHLMAERYVDNEPDYDRDQTDRNIAIFKRMLPEIHKVDNVKAQEVRLYSDLLQLAGTVDLVADYDGTQSVIDYKTSTKIKLEKYIQGYMVQCTAYSYMIEERYGLVIPKIVVMIAVEGSTTPQVFSGDRKDYREELMKRIKAFRKLQKKEGK